MPPRAATPPRPRLPRSAALSFAPRRLLENREGTAVALTEHGGVVHLLRVRGRACEGARRRGAGQIGRAVASFPEPSRHEDHAVVPELPVVEWRPPSRIPAPIHPPLDAFLLRVLVSSRR